MFKKLGILGIFFLGALNASAAHIFEVIDAGNLEEFKKIVEQDPSQLSQRVENSLETPLHMAICAKDNRIAFYLLETLPLDKLTVTTRDGFTPLHFAGMNGRLDQAMILVKKLSLKELMARDSFGYTARQISNIFHHEGVAQFLERSIGEKIKALEALKTK